MKPYAPRHSLEEPTASRSIDLAKLNHEIRTPINAIVGLVHLLRRDRPTPEQAERLSKIASATEHLLCIVDDILDHPKIDAPANEPNAEAILRNQCSSARLLLVEDNPVNRGVALDLLLAAGLAADTAANGLEAVEKAALMNYDLILMDVQMPIMNGLEATRVIRLQHGGAAVPILAMTANAFEEARRACLEAGMNDFVAKPVNPHDFYVSLLTWLPAAKQQACSPLPTSAIHREAGRWQLARVPDLDSECGLATMRGNTDKYTAVLRLFANECHLQAANLSGMLARDEFAAIEPAACSLRGTAAMLGALKVSTAAGAAILACRNHVETDAIVPACNVLIEELSRCAGSIEAVVPETVGTAIPEANPGQLAELLTRLEALLEHGNIEATHLARQNAGLLQAVFGTKAKTLLARIDAFDFEGSLAELRQALAGMKGAAD